MLGGILLKNRFYFKLVSGLKNLFLFQKQGTPYQPCCKPLNRGILRKGQSTDAILVQNPNAQTGYGAMAAIRCALSQLFSVSEAERRISDTKTDGFIGGRTDA